MKKFYLILSAGFLVVVLLYNACTHEPSYLTNSDVIVSTGCSPDTVYFVNSVMPLIFSNCAIQGCHDGSSGGEDEAGPLTDYVSIVSTGGVRPYNPSQSRLYTSVTGGGEEKMPPAPRTPLTQAQTDLIAKWINQGAFNNYCIEENCDSINVTFSGTIMPIIQNYCMGCHSGSSPGGNIRLQNYNDVVIIANNGKLVGTITHAAGFKPMPQSGLKISDCNIAQIKKWISDGTPEN